MIKKVYVDDIADIPPDCFICGFSSGCFQKALTCALGVSLENMSKQDVLDKRSEKCPLTLEKDNKDRIAGIKLMEYIIRESKDNSNLVEKVLELTTENRRLYKENFELRTEVNILNSVRKEPFLFPQERQYYFTREKLRFFLVYAFTEGLFKNVNGLGMPGFTFPSINDIQNRAEEYAKETIEKLDEER